MIGVRRLSDDDVRELREMFRLGVRRKVIAARFGVSNSALYRIANGQSYKDVTHVSHRATHRCVRCGCPI